MHLHYLSRFFHAPRRILCSGTEPPSQGLKGGGGGAEGPWSFWCGARSPKTVSAEPAAQCSVIPKILSFEFPDPVAFVF